jgi:hypothetical protein
MRNISTRHGVMKVHGGTVRHKRNTIGKQHPAYVVYEEEYKDYPPPGHSHQDTNLERLRRSLETMRIGHGIRKTYANF